MRILPLAGIGVLGLGIALPVFAAQTTPFQVVISSSPNPFAIKGTTSVNNSEALLAYTTGTKDVALEGYAQGAGSAGLEGFANSTSGAASNGVFGDAANGYGVLGVATSNSFTGIYGGNTSTAGNAVGVSGSAGGPSGDGVYGTTTASSPIGYGVFGLDSSTDQNANGVGGSSKNGVGVDGSSTTGYGVAGESASGFGVYGSTNNTTAATGGIAAAGIFGIDTAGSGGPNAGVFGTSVQGIGVYGVSSTGTGIEARSTSGMAINAESAGGGVDAMDVTSDDYFGVHGITDDDSGVGNLAGVYGDDESSQQNESTLNAGVLGASSFGEGVLAASGHGSGILASSQQGAGATILQYQGGGTPGALFPVLDLESIGGDDIIEAYGQANENDTNGQDVMTLDYKGNMVLAGGLTQHGSPQSTVRDARGAERVAYSQRATQSTIEDFGRAEMTGGVAAVRLDPAFAGTLVDGDYLVFLTAEGVSNSLYVTNRSLSGFEIRESNGHATMGVEYRIVGRPRPERAEPRLAYFTPSISNASARAHAAKMERLAQGFFKPRNRAPHARLAEQTKAFTHVRTPHRLVVPKAPHGFTVPQIGWHPAR